MFDWSTALNFNGDSSVYVQYNYARIQSILSKADFDYSNPDFTLLISAEEIALIKEVSRFESVVLATYRNLNPSILTNYAYTLTAKFSQFYSAHSILNCENEEVKTARTYLINQTAQAIQNTLNLLGIDTVNTL